MLQFKLFIKSNSLYWSYIKQIVNAFTLVQRKEYFHSVTDGMFHSARLSPQGCQITTFLEPNRHYCHQENNENKSQIQRKTKSIVKSLAPKMH